MTTLADKLGSQWYKLLRPEFDKQYMKSLSDFIVQRRKQTTVYPSNQELFTAYRLTSFTDVKVCIIGQDPYIRANEAHGLAFSTKGKSTPSLRKIAEVIGTEGWSNDLTRWAEQGVFLLNKVLTVDEGNSNSHKDKGWEQFTAQTVSLLSQRGKVIFLLWGSHAKEYAQYVNAEQNVVITAEHPAAAVYQGRTWINNDCFNQVNKILKSRNQEEIKW